MWIMCYSRIQICSNNDPLLTRLNKVRICHGKCQVLQIMLRHDESIEKQKEKYRSYLRREVINNGGNSYTTFVKFLYTTLLQRTLWRHFVLFSRSSFNDLFRVHPYRIAFLMIRLLEMHYRIIDRTNRGLRINSAVWHCVCVCNAVSDASFVDRFAWNFAFEYQ